MLEFKKMTLEDIDILRDYFICSKSRICDNTVGAAFMWRDYFDVEYAIYDETVVFKANVIYHNNTIAFSLPLGKNIDNSLCEIEKYAAQNNMKLTFFNIIYEELSVLKKRFPNHETLFYRDWSDYLYRATDLSTLSGRRYSGQRNHINYFKREYSNHSFEEITQENVADVLAFFRKLSRKLKKDSGAFLEEYKKVIEMLENFNIYRLLGGLLRVNGDIIAFSLGEILNRVLFIHVEKADVSYRGAYQLINNEFAKHFVTAEVTYINREEDVGDEGLRTSKKSLHPCEIIDKYIFTVK